MCTCLPRYVKLCVVEKMELNAAQSEALKNALSGHNIILLGAAGTGKTYLVSEIAKSLKKQGKSVALTATTGISCCLYDDAQTIHRWSGIGDGRYDVSEIRTIVENNVKYSSVRNRIRSTDVLIIDECSMLSKKVFDSLNEVCKLKDPNLPFGGIQLLLAGDFTQLPPVPNQLYSEEGEFCFMSTQFDKVLPHKVMLTEVVRQSENVLIKAINEVAFGKISTETETFIKSLRRPLPPDIEPVKLFSRNEHVDELNRRKIIEFPGQLYEFQCTDEGDQKYLNKILAPKTLWLKKGAPVILLRNLSDKLVNGLRGNVHDITEIGPVIDFPALKMKVPLEKLKFSVFSPSRNCDIASRLQYPVKLGFAISIHKSQGLTLESLEIDCRQIFKPGQLGVALGRARNTEGLRVINFNAKQCVIPQPSSVLDFLEREGDHFKEDKSCCNSNENRSKEKSSIDTAHFSVDDMLPFEETAELDNQQPSLDEFDEEFDDVIRMITESQNESLSLPDDLDLKEIVNNTKCKVVITPKQYNVNKILTDIDDVKLSQFCKNEYSKMSRFIEDLKIDPSKSLSSKAQTDFYKKVHEYQISAEFRMNCLKLFENSPFTEEHLHICFSFSNQIRIYLLKKKAELFPVGSRKISQRQVTNASEARVRYVGGYCVAKLRYKYMQKKNSYMYKVDELSQAIYDDSLQAVTLLDALKVEEYYILATTTNPESLLDVSRRQAKNRGLTNIPDTLFHFFKNLTEKCLALLIDENMNTYGSRFFEEVRGKIMEDDQLYQDFFRTVKSCLTDTMQVDENKYTNEENINSIIKQIFGKIIKLFLMVMVNQFRKDVMEAFHVKKKMAHRKQVTVSEKSKEKKSKDSKDDSPSPSSSQDIVNQPESSQCARKQKKKQKSTEETIEVSRQRPSTSSENTEELPSKSKRIRKQKKSTEYTSTSESETEVIPRPKSSDIHEDSVEEDDDNVPCKVCNLNQSQAPNQFEWINCDSCNGWFHRKCAGLNHHLKWKKMNKKGVKFYCQQCE